MAAMGHHKHCMLFGLSCCTWDCVPRSVGLFSALYNGRSDQGFCRVCSVMTRMHLSQVGPIYLAGAANLISP